MMQLIKKKRKVLSFETEELWFDIGTPKDLKKFNKSIRAQFVIKLASIADKRYFEFFDNLEESLNNDIENKIQFTKKVSKFRNKATEKNLNEKFHFIDLKIFNVREGFPKITRKEITSTTVQNVKYSID